MKKVNKLLSKVIIFIIGFSLIFSINIPKVFADVGDYGSDWSDSSWDSSYDSSWDSDWGSSYDSSWDSDWGSSYDYSYSSSSGSDLSDIFWIFWIFGDSPLGIMLVIFIIAKIATGKSRRRNTRMNWYNADRMRNQARNEWYNYHSPNGVYGHVRRSYQNVNYTNIDGSSSIINNAQKVEEEILKIDELFSREEFESWVKQIFIKLQYAWTDRNWAEIRTFETNELFEQHNTQLNRYIMKNQINVLERVAVNWVKLYKFYRTAEKDVLEVVLNSKMIDYIIDEKTGNVISGDKYTSRIRTYKLTFVRTIGVKTTPGKTFAKAMNCPNCGGQLTMTQAGKCEYCGSIVVVDDHGWALSELEPFTKENN